MSRRLIVVMLGPVPWTPPGLSPDRWRAALAEDVVDRVATLNGVDAAVAATTADRPLAEAIVWPGMRVYEVPAPRVGAVFAAAVADGYDHAAVVAADAPDVPGLLLGKLLRPLTTRSVAVAPALGSGPGLLGVAARLPAPAWLPEVNLDTDAAGPLRRAAPRPAEVAITPGWRRIRAAADLATLDPAVDGWDSTRALLGG